MFFVSVIFFLDYACMTKVDLINLCVMFAILYCFIQTFIGLLVSTTCRILCSVGLAFVNKLCCELFDLETFLLGNQFAILLLFSRNPFRYDNLVSRIYSFGLAHDFCLLFNFLLLFYLFYLFIIMSQKWLKISLIFTNRDNGQ